MQYEDGQRQTASKTNEPQVAPKRSSITIYGHGQRGETRGAHPEPLLEGEVDGVEQAHAAVQSPHHYVDCLLSTQASMMPSF